MNPDDFSDYEICPDCNGSGEGSHEGIGCATCGGEGEILCGPSADEPEEFEEIDCPDQGTQVTESITWLEGLPPDDRMVLVWRGSHWVSAWFDFSAARWRDVKYMILGDVTRWADVKGPK